MALAGKPFLQDPQVLPFGVSSLGHDHMDMCVGHLEVGEYPGREAPRTRSVFAPKADSIDVTAFTERF